MLSVARKPKDDTGLGNVEGGKSRVGPYRLCVELATGGMSVVYLARKEGTQGVVALKVLSPELTKDPTYLDMFVDETNIASRIRHPNVCTVFDFDRTEGDCYIAMEYIIGEPATAMRGKLARRQGDAASNARHIARFLSDVCEGLHAAHELCDEDGEPLNVVHRDISPENLFLTYDGVAKIVDFGLVNSTTQHHRTRTGLLKGKFAYIAPEMLNGQRPDRRADIWGLGLVARQPSHSPPPHRPVHHHKAHRRQPVRCQPRSERCPAPSWSAVPWSSRSRVTPQRPCFPFDPDPDE